MYKYIIALFAIAIIASCKKESQIPAPVACIENVDSGQVALRINFKSCTTDGESYAWDFGDGGTSTSENPGYTYDTAGTYTVTLTATNSAGSNTTTELVNVVCKDAYEGNTCLTESYLKYTGTYTASESCSGSAPNFSNYSATINAGDRYDRLELVNFFGNGAMARLNIHTNQSNLGNHVEIPLQTHGIITFAGSGDFNSNTGVLTLNLNYTKSGTPYQCTHTLTKQ